MSYDISLQNESFVGLRTIKLIVFFKVTCFFTWRFIAIFFTTISFLILKHNYCKSKLTVNLPVEELNLVYGSWQIIYTKQV